MPEGKNFNEWLQNKHNLGPRSASDIVSRYKRYRLITQEREFQDAQEAIYYLARLNEFDTLSKTVQSQLRRAVKLAFQYLYESQN